MFNIFLTLLLAVSIISTQSQTQNPEIHSKKSDTPNGNTGNAENPLNQVLLKAVESFVPSHLKFLAKSAMGNFDSKRIIKSVAHYIIPTASDNNDITQQCREDSWIYVESLTKLNEWAFKMLDATGKINEGAFSGNYHSMGHFDQCLKIKGPEEVSDPKFTGKYCTVFLKPVPVSGEKSNKTNSQPKMDSLPFLPNAQQVDAELLKMLSPRDVIKQVPSIALCLPSSCSDSDIETGLTDITASIGLPEFNGIKIVPFVSEDFCTVAGTQRDYDTATIIGMLIFGTLVAFLVLGTAHDAYLRYSNQDRDKSLRTGGQLLLSFSVLSNCESILDVDNSAEGCLGCLHGIRSLSCFWVVLFHTYTGALENPNANTAQVKEDETRFYCQIVVNGTLAVDSFFFLSGLLVCYTKLRELDRRNGKLNVPMMYLNRYLRLTPLCAFLLAFVAMVFARLSTGPYWGTIVMQSQSCRNSWWYYLSYTNNFFNGDTDVSTCMPAAWYLAVDLQLFLLSPIFVYVLWRRPKLGIALLGVASLVCSLIAMLVIYLQNLPPTFILTKTVDPKSLLKYYSDYYQMPWCRIVPYLVGIFMGYVLHTKRNVKVTLKPWIVVTGWTAAASIGSSVLFGMYEYVDETKVPVISQTVSVLYGSLHRTAWAVSLSWLVLACVHGYGGIVNRILSGSVFIPLSRLTYCTYMIHGLWLSYYYGRVRTVDYYTASDLGLHYFINMLVSLSLAFVAAVCIETPFQNLQKLFLSAKTRQRADQSENGHLVARAHDTNKDV